MGEFVFVRLQVDEDDFRLGNKSVTGFGCATDRSAFLASIQQFGFVPELISRTCPAVERHLRHFGQDDDVLEVVLLAEQDAAGLSHAFDHQRPRHHGKAGEVIVQVLFRQRHILDGRGVAAAFKFVESVNPKPTHGDYPSLFAMKLHTI